MLQDTVYDLMLFAAQDTVSAGRTLKFVLCDIASKLNVKVNDSLLHRISLKEFIYYRLPLLDDQRQPIN